MEISKTTSKASKNRRDQPEGSEIAKANETRTGGQPLNERSRLADLPRKTRTPIEQVRAEYDAMRKTFSPGELLKERWVPDLYRDLHMRVLTGRCSHKDRIKLTCAECFGWQNVREEVRNCQVKTCHLWGARPYQTKKTKKLSEK